MSGQAGMRKGRPDLFVAVPIPSQKAGDNLAYQDDTQGCLLASIAFNCS